MGHEALATQDVEGTGVHAFFHKPSGLHPPAEERQMDLTAPQLFKGSGLPPLLFQVRSVNTQQAGRGTRGLLGLNGGTE